MIGPVSGFRGDPIGSEETCEVRLGKQCSAFDLKSEIPKKWLIGIREERLQSNRHNYGTEKLVFATSSRT